MLVNEAELLCLDLVKCRNVLKPKAFSTGGINSPEHFHMNTIKDRILSNHAFVSIFDCYLISSTFTSVPDLVSVCSKNGQKLKVLFSQLPHFLPIW